MRITPSEVFRLSLGTTTGESATVPEELEMVSTGGPAIEGPAAEGPPVADMTFADGLNAWRSPGAAFTKVQDVFTTNNEYRGIYLAGLLGVPLAVLFLLTGKRR